MGIRQLHIERAERFAQARRLAPTRGTMSLPCAATQTIATCAGEALRSPAIRRLYGFCR
jgi:hypothetical protein